jgi:2-succinyl-5-enolpyruvyl-6-hydroxy-3-cyclohexene-1-carboxylate synthase
MKPEEMDITTLWAELTIEELVRSGVTTFIISPGSRSTPLALAVARNKRVTIITHFDERGAGFVGVGYARATYQPAALICTSGTAVANYLPSVVEASMDHLPMIVLSADRPPELQDTGANQTIKQSGIFGSFVRWEETLPCPTESIPAEFILTTIDQAVFRATHVNPGPVHLNCQFREPLLPDPRKAVDDNYTSSIRRWRSHTEPHTVYSTDSPHTSGDEFDRITKPISAAKSGLLVVGRLKQTEDEISTIVTLSERLGWPVVTDIGSGLRLGQGISNHFPYFDLTLVCDAGKHQFDCILHLGGPLVSKRVNEFIASQKSEYVVVNEYPERQDVGHCATRRIVAPVGAFASILSSRLIGTRAKSGRSIEDRNTAVKDILNRQIDSGTFSELPVPRIVGRAISREHALFLASSLTVRDFDMYAPTDGPRVPVGCNRGASGIDGTVASAVGFAHGLNKPTTLVIGDTALLHDLNSLALLRDEKTPPLTIVVVNNGGGAIFSMLPVSESVDAGTFEKLFLQRHTLDFRAAAKMFGLTYANPTDASRFREAYGIATAGGKPSLIELRFDWRESRRVRLELREKIITALGRK